ncbi:MAG TPA: TadE/TadG family type IV pilus assembly protein [Stellaceae bacterium]|nr:TadE/TadG family type IV pilus assembly protein [Stellaceae bacterium]
MKITRSLLSFAGRLGASRSGAAAVELGLVAPMLVGILLPMVDLGMGAYNKMRVQNAAEAGAQYALEHGYNSSSITTAAQNSTSLGTGVTVSPSQACNCINSGVIGPSVTCGAACSDGSTAGTFVTVNTQSTYTLLISYPGLTNPMTLRGLAVVRVN